MTTDNLIGGKIFLEQYLWLHLYPWVSGPIWNGNWRKKHVYDQKRSFGILLEAGDALRTVTQGLCIHLTHAWISIGTMKSARAKSLKLRPENARADLLERFWPKSASIRFYFMIFNEKWRRAKIVRLFTKKSWPKKPTIYFPFIVRSPQIISRRSFFNSRLSKAWTGFAEKIIGIYRA